MAAAVYNELNSSVKVAVTYAEDLSTDKVVQKISQLQSPHVCLWYIGTYGLKKEGVKFYKESLITPVLKASKNVTFELLDLTAWTALKDPNSTITKVSSFTDKIKNDSIHWIKSADIFKRMQDLDKEAVEYFKKALKREFIHLPSKDMAESKIMLGSIFNKNCPVVSDWFDVDTSKGYSVLQYLETCLFVEKVVLRCLETNKACDNIQFVFALPNDEIKYYRDETNAFQNDVEYLINRSLSGYKEKMQIEIKFLSFKYGDVKEYRPYNAPGPVFKKNELNVEHILSNQNEESKLEAVDGSKS